MTGWLQAASPQEVQFSKFGRDDLLDIKRLGCDVVRLPINLQGMNSGPPSYRIDPLLYTFLDPIVAWADELGLHLILDNHSFDPSIDTSPQVGQVLVPVWRQLAAHFADHPARLYYEVLSEPHGIADTTWNRIQGEVIEAIRQVGPAACNRGWPGRLEQLSQSAADALLCGRQSDIHLSLLRPVCFYPSGGELDLPFDGSAGRCALPLRSGADAGHTSVADG